MDIRSELCAVRAEYEQMHTYDLVLCLQSMGVDRLEVLALSRSQLIERLMALEESAAFH